MGKRDPRVDAHIANAPLFAKPLLTFVRDAVHSASTDIDETLKWQMPTFMHGGAIICGMGAFKEHMRFGFWPGPGLGRFEHVTTLDDLPSKSEIAAGVKKAIAFHRSGVKPVRKKPAPKKRLPMPRDLAAALAKRKSARAGFEAFSPSHRREYIEWITDAKTAETRARRIGTAIEWIAEGKPRNWKYMKRA